MAGLEYVEVRKRSKEQQHDDDGLLWVDSSQNSRPFQSTAPQAGQRVIVNAWVEHAVIGCRIAWDLDSVGRLSINLQHVCCLLLQEQRRRARAARNEGRRAKGKDKHKPRAQQESKRSDTHRQRLHACLRCICC